MTTIDHIGQLLSDKQNRRRHNPRNVGMIADALHEVGAARSIVIDELGTVLAGNATIEAAAQAGIERVRVVDADGETIIAVRRSGLTEQQKKRLALYDNRAAELADWDVPVLLSEPDLLAGLFRDDEVARLLGQVAEPVDPAELWAGMPEFEQEYAGDLRSITVHFKSEDAIQAFEELVGQAITPQTRSIFYPKNERVDFKDHRVQDEP